MHERLGPPRDVRIADTDGPKYAGDHREIDYLAIISSRWPSIVAWIAVSLAVAAAYLAVATPAFTTTALIAIESNRDVVRRNPAVSVDANVISSNIDSEVEVLRSERIFRAVAQARKSTPAARSLAVKLKEYLEPLISSSFLAPYFATGPDKISSPEGAAAKAVREATTAKRIGLTHIIEISATDLDPASAAGLANAYAQAFISDQIHRREEIARQTSAMLQERTQALQTQTEEAERAVEQLKFSGAQQSENSASARVRLNKLESAAQTYRVLHDKFLERYAETWQEQFLSVPEARLVSEAFPPLTKSQPKTLLILAGAIFVGMALGMLRILLAATPYARKR